MSVIAYDRPVKDLIAGLDATGHVTHTAYRKTSVTLHHNGGRLSHEGVLNVWQTREASAHFDVDGSGDIAQYVRVNEYAWATGNTEGNQTSISIEQCNSTLGPDWQVAEVTWRSACRLAGWLFARVIGARPSADNFFVHHHWKQTACAGPFIDSIFNECLAAAQAAYDEFVGGPTPPPPPPPPPAPAPQKSINEIAREVIDGQWGNGPDRQARLSAAGYDYNAVQAEVNRILGAAPAPPPQKSISELANEVIAGLWGNGPERAARLTAAGYNAAAVQAEVNRRYGQSGGGGGNRIDITTLARQVIAGQWGNGPERQRRLTAAGYNYAQVQAEVNRLLG